VGELRLGRQYAHHDEVNIMHNPFNGSTVLFPGGAGLTNTGNNIIPQFIDAPRVDNVVQYLTPNFAGFTGQVAVGLGEGVNDRYHGLKAAYIAGPIVLAASYEWNKDRSSGASTNKVFTGAASYDFSVAKVYAGVQAAKDLTNSPGSVGAIANWTITGPVTFVADELKGYTVGVGVPVSVWTFGANYTNTKYSGAGRSLDLGRVAAGARYYLSKSTHLYGAVSVATGDLKEYLLEKRMIEAGMRVAF
jgi:predicted porin